jgi:hypothetical protein
MKLMPTLDEVLRVLESEGRKNPFMSRIKGRELTKLYPGQESR